MPAFASTWLKRGVAQPTHAPTAAFILHLLQSIRRNKFLMTRVYDLYFQKW
jgi:hypothetical protein